MVVLVLNITLFIAISATTAYQLYANPAHPELLKRWIVLLILYEIQDLVTYFLGFIPFFTFAYQVTKFLTIHPQNLMICEKGFQIVKLLDHQLLASRTRKVLRKVYKYLCIGMAIMVGTLIKKIEPSEELQNHLRDLLIQIRKVNAKHKEQEGEKPTKESPQKVVQSKQSNWDKITTNSSENESLQVHGNQIKFRGELVVIRGTKSLPSKMQVFDVVFYTLRKELRLITTGKKVYEKHIVQDLKIVDDLYLQFFFKENYIRSRLVKFGSKDSCLQTYQELMRWIHI